MQTTHIDFSHYDVHPPGSYMVQDVWYKLNPGFRVHQWLRLLSVLMGGLFILCVGLFAFEVFSEYQAVARSVLLLSVGTSFLQYATEARMYIFVMLLAAFACYAGVMAARRASVEWGVAGIAAMFLLPMFHYYACFVVPFILAIWWIVHSESGYDRAWAPPLVAGVFAVVGAAISAFSYALPQMQRVGGLMLKLDGFNAISVLSGWFFGFQFMGDQITNVFIQISILLIVLLGLSFVCVKLIREKHTNSEWKILMAMYSTILVVPAGLIFGLFVAYHHRYVLVELWMLVLVTYYVLLSRVRWKEYMYAGMLAISIVFVVFWFRPAYGDGQVFPEMTFQEMAKYIPCDDDVVIVHETTFSYFPALQYGVENGCVAKNILATQMDERWAAGVGADAILLRGEHIWVNGSFNTSEGKFIYVNVLNDTLGVQNKSCVIWSGDGKLNVFGEIDWIDSQEDYGGKSCNVTFEGRMLIDK